MEIKSQEHPISAPTPIKSEQGKIKLKKILDMNLEN